MEAQYEVLRPFVTERILSLMKSRLFEGARFFERHTLKAGITKAEAKLALVLVKIANPQEPLSEEENALICTRQQVRHRLSRARGK